MLNSNDSTCQTDVIVIGGGPAGSTASALLAKRGYRVSLFERDKFPRFHIGESLIPFSYHIFEELGLIDKLRASHFTKKYGVQFISEHGRLSEPFRFEQYDAHDRSQTWQVRRSEFDEILLDHSKECGTDVYQETRVTDIITEQDRVVGVKVRGPSGPREIRSRVVIDASGQSSMLMDRFQLRQWDDQLKKAAIWTYWKGAVREPGLDGGGTIVIQTKEKKGWFWYIPLHDDIVSVGVVADYDYLFKNRDSTDIETIYFEEVSRCPGIQPRIANCERSDGFRVQKEYSYRAKKVAGDGWVLVGDAFGFLDPLYSSGVFLALKSGSLAAKAVGDALEKNDVNELSLRCWEQEYCLAMERMRKLVIAFYDGLNFGKLVRNHPDKKHLITDILTGNLFDSRVDELWPLIADQQENQLALS